MDSNFVPDCPDLMLPSRPRRKNARLVLLLSTVMWAALVATGLWWLWGYENAPGVGAISPSQWPSQSRIQLAPNGPTLVMLAHPHCPCTRASIGELARIMTHSQGEVRAYVLFTRPEGSPEDWEKTDLWHSAADIPGVTVVKDSEGVEARLFNAATSGQTVLYNTRGQLLFSGGITGSRGHFGDNAGQGSVIAILKSEVPGQTETSVFGCPLFNPQSECKVLNDEGNK
ncbi:MAG: RedB protein [Acidobacteriota bacterium]